MHPSTWFTVLQQEYLRDYVKAGGSAVKFAVLVDESEPREICRAVTDLAIHEHYLGIHLDARESKVHLIDLLFYDMARRIDWDEYARRFVVACLERQGCTLPDPQDSLNWGSLARCNRSDENSLRREVHAWLEQALYHDYAMCLEFRLAMIQLCLAQLDSERDKSMGPSICAWLRGELRQISVLRDALIFQKITRSNARHMLMSCAHWLRLAGTHGLVISLDISAFVKPSPVKQASISYTVSAVLDAYEMLRQCIDSTEDMEGMLMVIVAPQDFLTNQRLGLSRYEALKLRIFDDVRDKHRQNPLAPMVRLSHGSTSQMRTGSLNPPQAVGHPHALAGRRVIESLRCGVPSTAVVRVLGCSQPTVRARFRQLLHEARDSIAKGWTTKGLLIEGGFGTGKSHVLEALRHMALEQRFVCSKVVIGKETPLYSPSLIFRAALESAAVPDRRGEVLREVLDAVNFQSPQYTQFYEWVHRQGGEVDARFAATLFLYERMVNDPELSYRLIRFWSGDPLTDTDIKRYLKACKAAHSYRFDRISPLELALQRFKFVSRLMVAAGYAGWILLIDEAEIMGRYSFKQRAHSYAELARWMGRLEASSFADLGYRSGLAAVLALTDDFQSAILDEKGDREKIPLKLRDTGSEADLVLARQAEQGMRLIDCERIPLVGPYDELVEDLYHKVLQLHGAAYRWDPPPVPTIERLSSTRLREYIKGWITEWDLKRLEPEAVVDLELTEVQQDYSEDLELESVAEDQPHSLTAIV